MLVYRSSHVTVSPRERLRALASEANGASLEDARDRLVDLGALEAAIVDALCPEVDEVTATTRALREAMIGAAEAFVAGEGADSGAAFGRSVAQIASLPLPAHVELRPPEGFVHYGLYPEAYGEAARRYREVTRPSRIVCIGLRSIGTTLSAVVAAALARDGCEVASVTLRPRGHPFDRTIALGPDLAAMLGREAAHASFVVVDEGPGLSGSSLTSVAQALLDRGVPEGRIALFPSWVPSGDGFVSARARDVWGRVAKHAAEIDLRRLVGEEDAIEVSGGAWRSVLVPDGAAWPAVQPQHERRKLVTRASGHPARLFKFAAFGEAGRAKLRRAARLADAAFAPPVHGLRHGLLVTDVAPGAPLGMGGTAAPAHVIERVAAYAAFVGGAFRTGAASPCEALADLLATNAREALGDAMGDRAARIALPPEAEAVVVDGRMLAHEWIADSNGSLLKVDGVDHGEDHFHPGPVDVAWDLAGAAVELALTPDAVASLLDAYARASGDAGMAARLPFHRAAYLAFRLGYVRTARAALGEAHPEVPRFAELEARYEAALADAIVRA